MKKKTVLAVFALIALLLFALIYFTTETVDDTPQIAHPTITLGNDVISKDLAIYDYASPIYIEKSDTTAILLIHGYLASPQEVEELANFLSDQGYTVYAPLMSGHGTSPKDLANTRWEQWREESEEYYSILARNYEEVHVIGFSLGALSAISLATNHDLPSLTLIGSPLFTVADQLEVLNPEKRILEFSKHVPNLRKPGLKDEILDRKTYAAIPLTSVNEVLAYSKTMKPLLEEVEEETLIIHGKFDLTANPQSAPFLLEHINSSEVYYVDSLHTVLNGIFQEDVFERISDFLAEN